ncbi:MAG: hypothetical protein AAF146_20260, partial [Bacteroidota bacterium]
KTSLCCSISVNELLLNRGFGPIPQDFSAAWAPYLFGVKPWILLSLDCLSLKATAKVSTYFFLRKLFNTFSKIKQGTFTGGEKVIFAFE